MGVLVMLEQLGCSKSDLLPTGQIGTLHTSSTWHPTHLFQVDQASQSFKFLIRSVASSKVSAVKASDSDWHMCVYVVLTATAAVELDAMASGDRN